MPEPACRSSGPSTPVVRICASRSGPCGAVHMSPSSPMPKAGSVPPASAAPSGLPAARPVLSPGATPWSTGIEPRRLSGNLDLGDSQTIRSAQSGGGVPQLGGGVPCSGERSPSINLRSGVTGVAGEVSARVPPLREARFHPRASAKRSRGRAEPFPPCTGSRGRAPPSP